MTIKRILFLIIILATISLATPFICLKIGPKGYEFYGPNVPDIYILGATILGKDRNFWGIAFASTIQLIAIIYFIISTYLATKNVDRNRPILFYTIINLVLLLLFPFWLSMYVDGVISNSDGAASDLTIYPHVGILIYLALLILNIVIIIKSTKLPAGNNPLPQSL